MRPVKYTLVGRRGRAYECGSCHNYQGEKRDVQSHFYNNHVKPEDIPFRCKLCNFKCTTEKELKNHVEWYKDHQMLAKRRKQDGLEYSEVDILVKSKTPYIPQVERDLIRLDISTSEKLWESRSRKPKAVDKRVVSVTETSLTKTDPLKLTPEPLLPLHTSNEPMPTLPDITFENGDETINLIDQILGEYEQETLDFTSFERDEPHQATTITTTVPTVPEPTAPDDTSIPVTNISTSTQTMDNNNNSTSHNNYVTQEQFNRFSDLMLQQISTTNALISSLLKQMEDSNRHLWYINNQHHHKYNKDRTEEFKDKTRQTSQRDRSPIRRRSH